MDKSVSRGLSGSNTQTSIEDELFGSLGTSSQMKSTFAHLVTNSTMRDQHQQDGSTDVRSSEKCMKRCFRDLGYSGDPRENVDFAKRKAHCKAFGGNFFIPFIESSEMQEDESNVKLGLDAYPKTCICKDTLHIGGYEASLRGHTSIDVEYMSVMEAIAVSDDTTTQGKLFRLARKLYNVDPSTHKRAVDMVMAPLTQVKANVGVVVSGVTVRTDIDSVREGHIVCVVEVCSAKVSQATKVVRELDKNLYVAAKALSPTDDLTHIKALLDEGADPRRAGSKRGYSAMDVANHLNYPRLIQMFENHTSSAGDPGDPGDLDDDLDPDSNKDDHTTSTDAVIANAESLPSPLGTDSVIRIPDRLDLSVNKSSVKDGATLHIWFWNIRNSPPVPDDSIQRRFVSSTESLSDGVEVELLGTVSTTLSADTVDNPQTVQLKPKSTSKSNLAPEIISVEFSFHVTRSRADVQKKRRNVHRTILARIHHAALPKVACDGDIRTAYDGGKISTLQPLIDVHAQFSRMSAVEQAIDELCAVVEAHAEKGATPSLLETTLSKIVQLQEGARLPWTSLLSLVDQSRLLGCVEAIVTTCMAISARPLQYFCEDSVALKQVQSSITVLMLAFSIELWRNCTTGKDSHSSDEEEDTSSIGADATVFQTPVIKAAAKALSKQKNVNYMKIKTLLIEKYGETEFSTYKGEIQKMCMEYDQKKSATGSQYIASPQKRANATKKDVLDHAKNILLLGRKRTLKYRNLRVKLLQTFDSTLVEECRRETGILFIEEMGIRSGLASEGKAKKIESKSNDQDDQCLRSLKDELLFGLKRFCHETYALVKTRSRTATQQNNVDPAIEFTQLTNSVKSLTGFLRDIHAFFHAEYVHIETIDLTTAFSHWLDGLIGADIREIINQYSSRSSEEGLPFAFYRLYHSTRTLWNFMETKVPENINFKFIIASYEDWFLPCVTDWLIQAKVSAIEMLDQSIKLDTWIPVVEDALVSQSCVDVMRTVYELTCLFTSIDWPDRTEKEERLFVHLCDAVCAVARSYADKIVRFVKLPRPEEVDGIEDDFYVDSDVCIRLNNLEEIKCRFTNLFHYLQVPHVNEAHHIRYGSDELKRPHRAIEFFNSTNVTIQNHVLDIGKKIGYLTCRRIKNDLTSTFSDFDPRSDRIDLARHSLEGLLMEADDFRVSPPKSSQKRRLLFNSKILSQAVASRKSSGTGRSGLKQDGYLRLNLYLLGTKLEFNETIMTIVLCIWMRYSFVLGSLLTKQSPTNECTESSWVELVLALKNVMMDFLGDNGDGVSIEELHATSNNILTPITECFQVGTMQLVEYFYAAAAANQSNPLNLHIPKTATNSKDSTRRISFTESFQDYGNDNESDSQIPASLMDLDYSKEILIAPFGKLKLRLIKFCDTVSGSVSVRVNVLSASKLSKSCSSYVSAWIVPDYIAGISRISFKTQVQKTPFNPIYDEGFTVSECRNGIAIQLNVMRKAEFSMSFESLFAGDEILGSLLVDLKMLSKIEGEVVIEFPLRAPDFTGHLGQVQSILDTRATSSKTARVFTKAIRAI